MEMTDHSGDTREGPGRETPPVKENDQDPAYWKKISAQQEKDGDIEGALASIDRAIRINPSDLPYWKTKERLYIRAGRRREAIFYHLIFDAMIPEPVKYLSLSSIPELFGKGLLEYGRTDTPQAAEYLKRVADHGNLPVFVWTILAQIFHKMGMEDRALQCETAAKEPAGGQGSSLLLAETLPNDLEARPAGTPQAAPAGPGWSDPWFETDDKGSLDPDILKRKGFLFYHKKFPGEAVIYFDRAFSLDPSDYTVYLSLHSGYVNLGFLEKSQACFERAFNLIVKKFGGYPQAGSGTIPPADYPVVWEAAKKNLATSSEKTAVSAIAAFLYQNKKYDEALVLLARIVALDPSMNDRMKLCDCYLNLGELDKAHEILDPEASKYPDNYIILAEQARLYNRAGDYPEALNSARKGIANNPSKNHPYFENCCEEQAYALWKLGRPNEAIAALEIVPENALEISLFILKGNILAGLGRYSEAAAALDRALLLNPDSSFILTRKGEWLERAGRMDEARACFEQASRHGSLYSDQEKQYKKHEKIGMGGLGTVYLGYDRFQGCFVALKTYRDEFSDNPQIRKQFRKEAEIWVRLGSHPNIVQARGVEVIDGRLYVVIDYIPRSKSGGNTLEGRLKEKDPGLHQVLEWAVQICRGMEHGYASGITCHRDIKPANIMISPDNVAMITDFGLADAFRFTMPAGVGLHEIPDNGPGGSYSSFHGKCAGTPTHMPPEQFTDADTCDVRSDIYSFGIVLFQMISCGSLPYPVRQLMEQRLAGPQAFAGFYRLHMNILATIPRLNSPLMPVILRCLQTDRSLRYPSFAELRAELKEIAGDLDAAGMKTDPGPGAKVSDEEISQKAGGLMKLGHYKDAAALFDLILARSSRNYTAWINKGICCRELQDFEGFLHCSTRAVEINPGERVGWEGMVTALYHLKRPDECRECCKKTLARFPKSRIALHVMAKITQERDGNEAALPFIQQALEADPDNSDLWIMKGVALSPPLVNQNGRIRYSRADPDRISQALHCYDEAIRLTPDNALALMHKAGVLIGSGHPHEAIGFYDLAIRADRHFSYAWGGKAIALAELGWLDKAITCCDEYLREHPAAEGIRGLRTEFSAIQRLREMEPGFERDFYREVPLPAVPGRAEAGGPIERSGHLPDGLVDAVQKGRELVLSGKTREAVAWFDTLIEKNPCSDALLVEKGVALGTPVRSGPVAISNPAHLLEALRCFEAAAALNPRCIFAHIQHGMLLSDQLDFSKAHASFDRALALDPRSVAALKGKAMTFAEAGRFDEAVEYCNRCLEIDSTRADVRYLREKYHKELAMNKKREPLPGIDFEKRFSSAKAAPEAPPGPSLQECTAEIRAFHDRFFRCLRQDNKGTLAVNMECVTDLVRQNPEPARQYVSWCCSRASFPLTHLQMIGFVGVAIQMLYGDGEMLALVTKTVQERGGKKP